MNPNSHSGRTAVLTAVLITTAPFLFAGCTSNRIDDVPNGAQNVPVAPADLRPSLKPAEQATVDQAWARYLKLTDVYVKAAQSGSYNWDSDRTKRPLYEYAAGLYLSTLEHDLATLREDGLVRTGMPAISLRRVVSVSPTSILVESCVDDTAVDVINKTTRKSMSIPGQNKKYPVTLRAGLYADGLWRWVESHADRASSC